MKAKESMPGVSDGDLLKLFRQPGKEEKAFMALVEKYQRPLYWHCRKIVIGHEDADDALQNTFIKVWKNLASFRGEAGIYTWLYRIATNESLNILNNKKKNFHPESQEDYENYLAGTLESDAYFDGDEAEKKLQQALLGLPEKQRLVFNMKYFDAMKYSEMAEILDTSVGALKASYHHAVKKIEQFLEGE